MGGGRIGWLVAAGALAAAVGGCSNKPPPGPCPAISVLRDASRAVQFVPGPGRDLIDIRFEAEIEPTAANCDYVDDDTAIEVELQMVLRATRGPAADSQETDFPFFVAIVGANQQILAKEVFASPIEFEEGRRRAAVQEETDQRIPLEGGKTGADYEILVGFQLTEAQLDYNRLRRRF